MKNDNKSSVKPLEKFEVDVVIKLASPKNKEINREGPSPKRVVKTTLGMASITNTSSLSSLLRKKISQGNFYLLLTNVEASLRNSFAPFDKNACLTESLKKSLRRYILKIYL